MGSLLSYLSFRGRANRQRFWLTALAIWAAMFLGAVLSVMLSNVSPFLSVLFLPLYLAWIVASLANGARRLHDRGKSAWWLLLFVGVPVVILLPAQLAGVGGQSDGSAALALICSLVSLPFSIWAFIEMGCLKGTTGANKYGDDPLQPTAAEVFA